MAVERDRQALGLRGIGGGNRRCSHGIALALWSTGKWIMTPPGLGVREMQTGLHGKEVSC
jgi:hypothetical protein